VLSLGDARSFYLSTAADDLGVVFARSEAAPGGAPLVAESDKHMRCPSTGAVEKRKVARQQQQR
jgi:exosome complex component CSL4